MERKVARQRGERTLEEQYELKNEIKQAEAEYNNEYQEFTQVTDSLKNLDDNLR